MREAQVEELIMHFVDEVDKLDAKPGTEVRLMFSQVPFGFSPEGGVPRE